MTIENPVPGYELLQRVLQMAYNQAAHTKGAERHANNLPFHEQPMQTIADHHGLGFLLGQAEKKAVEAHGMTKRGQNAAAIQELLGAINYLAGAVIFLEGQEGLEEKKEATTGPQTPEGKAEELLTAYAAATDAALAEIGDEAKDDACTCPVCTLERFLAPFTADDDT